MGKEYCARLSRRLWGGMKDKLPKKCLCGRLAESQLARTQHRELPEKGTEGRHSFPLNICFVHHYKKCLVTVNLKELPAIIIATKSNCLTYLLLEILPKNVFSGHCHAIKS